MRKMEKRLKNTSATGENCPGTGWLFFLYKVPSRPVNKRMKIWRKLNKAGAIQFKGAAYVLPCTENHYEFFDWLVSEVSTLGGEAALIKTVHVENIKDDDLVKLFNEQRESEYQKPAKSVQNLARKVASIRKGSKMPDPGTLQVQLSKCLREYEEVHSLDFFASEAGVALHGKIEELRKTIESFAPENSLRKDTAISVKNTTDFQGKTWVTRPNPFVDRMAAAWLVKNFIDPGAVFSFVEESKLSQIDKHMVSFDVRNGEFTHVGDLCTFEVLLKAFDLKDKKLKKIAEVVHDLDMKDDKYSSAEAKGLENILSGIRNSSNNDSETLEKGMAIFAMLYAALT